MNKKCTYCQELLEENSNNFYMWNKKKPELGFMAQCKKCIKEKSLIYRNEHLEHYRNESKKYNQAHSNIIKTNNIKYRTTKRDEKREYQKEYQKSNSNRLSEYFHKNHNITDEQWEQCKKYFNNSCAYCGISIENNFKEYRGNLISFDFSKDHVDDDGGDGIENCVPTCHSCNSKKWKFELDEWYNKENPIYDIRRYTKIISWLTLNKI